MANNRGNLKVLRKVARSKAVRKTLPVKAGMKRPRKVIKAVRGPAAYYFVSAPIGGKNAMSEEKMKKFAKKLQRKYRKAQKAMCSNCKTQPLTTIQTSFKVEGQDKKVEMRALIVDLSNMPSSARLPGITNDVNVN